MGFTIVWPEGVIFGSGMLLDVGRHELSKLSTQRITLFCLLLFESFHIIRVRLFWNGGFGMSHSGKGSSHLTRLRWRPLTGTTLPSA